MVIMNVGIWIRVSTEEQAHGESPKNHEEKAKLYAKLKGWSVRAIYNLDGVSGKSVIDHPETKRMLEDVKQGVIQGLIFSKLARLARNVKELLEISDHFKKYNANLISIEESIDTSSPAGMLLFTVIGALAQWEREEISARVSASVAIRAKQGKPLGGIGPYGYMWKDKKLVINPDEAVVIKDMFKIYLDKKTLLQTAKSIKDKGYKGRKGILNKTSIKRILTDPIYKGLRRANYTKSLGDKRNWKLKPKEEWVFTNIEPLVDKDMWEEVNRIINKNAEPFPNVAPALNSRYIFGGLLYCSCGYKMYVMKYKGMKIPRYICRGCRFKVNEDEIFDIYKEALKKIIIKPEILNNMKNIDLTLTDKEKLIAKHNRELKSIDYKIDKLFDFNDVIDKETIKDKFKKLNEEKNTLTAEINRLQTEINEAKIYHAGSNYILDKAKSLYDLWDSLQQNSKAEIIKTLTNKIIVSDNEIIIEMFFDSSLCKHDHKLMDYMKLLA